jgi:hypothetical protein
MQHSVSRVGLAVWLWGELVLSGLALAGCASEDPERPRALAWLELAGDPDASPAELGATLFAALSPRDKALLEARAVEASRVSGLTLTGADMIRFEGLEPGHRVRSVRVTPAGDVELTVDRVAGTGPRPEPLMLTLDGEPAARGIALQGVRPTTPGK